MHVILSHPSEIRTLPLTEWSQSSLLVGVALWGWAGIPQCHVDGPLQIHLSLSPCRGLVQNTHPSPPPYPNHSSPSHLHKIMWGLHITYTHTPVCIKSSLHYLQYLIECKCFVVLLHCIVNGIMTRESLYLFSMHIVLFSLNLALVESMNVCIHYILVLTTSPVLGTPERNSTTLWQAFSLVVRTLARHLCPTSECQSWIFGSAPWLQLLAAAYTGRQQVMA